MKQVEQKSLFIDKMGVLYFIRGKWFSNPYVIIFVYLWIYRTLWNINFNKHTKTSAIFRNSNEIEQMIMHTWPRMIVMASYSSILERKIFSMNDVSTHCWKNYFEIYFNNWRYSTIGSIVLLAKTEKVITITEPLKCGGV